MTIICAERGLLVLRNRDEIHMTVASYQTLYESSIAYGMRKALRNEKGKTDRVIEVPCFIKYFSDSGLNLRTLQSRLSTALSKDGLVR